ncbi:MAG: substrate-binding domain-containing protein, partial [Bacteroidota bacterium]
LAPRMKNKGQWADLPTEAYQAIEQGIVLIKREGGRNQAARQFDDFLFSPTAQQILTNFGYLSPN